MGLRETILGRTGLKVKSLGFGGIPIQRVSEEEAVRVVRRCYEIGINYYDTARGYTNSEERIGKVLEDVRQEVFLATKSGRRKAKEMLEELEISLKNLRTDWIDVYQLHNVSSYEAWDQIKGPGGALEALYKARDEGKIRHLGVTSHDPTVLAEIVREDIFETIMIPYNYLTLKPEEELLPLCKEKNVGTVIMKPFGGGAFSNANTALKFVLSKDYVDVAIPGMMTIAEVEENINVATGPHTLSQEELKLIEADRVELGDQFCRACNYCQPCPQEIPITFILRAESQFLKRMGWQPGTEERFAEAVEKADSCIECGECEARCPYHLPIRQLLPGRAASLTKLLETRLTYAASM
jgi:predicted aldo/keto reductase-like oxidoreductase